MLGQLHPTIDRRTSCARHVAGAASSIVLTLCLIAAIDCSPSNPDVSGQAKPPDSKKELKAPLREYEATLHPSDYDEEVEAVQKKQAEERPHSELEIPKDTSVIQEELQQGYRIQVFTTSSIDEATRMKVSVLSKLPQDSIYVVYDPPVYKVRIGDFPSRYDASTKLSVVVNEGYPDAWIVPDNIVRRKLIQVPRSSGQ